MLGSKTLHISSIEQLRIVHGGVHTSSGIHTNRACLCACAEDAHARASASTIFRCTRAQHMERPADVETVISCISSGYPAYATQKI